ncbi:hypothetical protein [Mesomycoplasma molare]|uniref:Uncharacterized protein n=1 Tax=Mesomycoplasma molare TaxID=171288 RepID=A0ABY5TY50_9BACT|nr:hypothetical protein [Mesomycoplasma molare]UWD34163.1 hypothetical protein NX772_03710 [Mesomycoplasma molare]
MKTKIWKNVFLVIFFFSFLAALIEIITYIILNKIKLDFLLLNWTLIFSFPLILIFYYLFIKFILPKFKNHIIKDIKLYSDFCSLIQKNKINLAKLTLFLLIIIINGILVREYFMFNPKIIVLSFIVENVSFILFQNFYFQEKCNKFNFKTRK